MNNRFFFTQIVPHDIDMKYNHFPASNKFCWNLINCKSFTKTISIVPITIKPSIDISSTKNIEYVQFRFFKHENIFKILNALFENIIVAWKCKKATSVWFYNISTFNLLAYLLIKYLLLKKSYIILTDHTPSKNTFSIQNFIKYLIKNCNGLIMLSGRTQISHKNLINIPGIVPEIKISNFKKDFNKPGNRTFFFSGALNIVTGFELVLEVFKDLPNITLLISGRFESEKELQLIQKHSNIHYLGFLSTDEYQNCLNNVDICLNLRNPYLKENEYNFPSKVLEYFSNFKPVLSTLEYPELMGCKYFTSKYDKESLKLEIIRLNFIQSSVLEEYANNSDMIQSKFGEATWSKSINQIEDFNKNTLKITL